MVKPTSIGGTAPVQATQAQIDFGPVMKAMGQALQQIGEIFMQQVLPQLIEGAAAAALTSLQKSDGFERGVQGKLAGKVKPLDVELIRQRKEVPFISQWDGKVPGAGEGASYKACRAMLHEMGIKIAPGPGDRIDVAHEGLHAVRGHVDAELAQGRPVALAIERKGGKTDYMLAVESPEKHGWFAYDPHHKDPAQGKSQLIHFDEKQNAMVHHDGERHGTVTGAVRSQGGGHVEHGHDHDHALLNSGPVAGIKRGPNAAPIPRDKQQALAELLHKSGSDGALLTSTSRTPQDQARIMFNNIRKHGVDSQHKLYAGPGDAVIRVYERMQGTGATDEQIKAAMAAEVQKQGPSRVSRHCAPEGSTVVDVAPSSIGGPAERQAFIAAVEQAQREGKVKTFLHPGNSTDPAFHIEFA